MVVAYIAAISGSYSVTILEHRANTAGLHLTSFPQVDERVRVKFNPNMSSTWFSGLLELLNMLTMVSSC